MNSADLQNFIVVTVIVAFFAYRYYRFKVIKQKLPELLKAGAILIDVRTSGEYSQGHNPLGRNIPLDVLNKESQTLDKSKKIILSCASGTRSSIAVGILRKNGFKHVMNAGPWTNTIQKA